MLYNVYKNLELLEKAHDTWKALIVEWHPYIQPQEHKWQIIAEPLTGHPPKLSDYMFLYLCCSLLFNYCALWGPDLHGRRDTVVTIHYSSGAYGNTSPISCQWLSNVGPFNLLFTVELKKKERKWKDRNNTSSCHSKTGYNQALWQFHHPIMKREGGRDGAGERTL